MSEDKSTINSMDLYEPLSDLGEIPNNLLGLDQMDEELFSFPVLKLIQAGDESGCWVNTLTSESYEQVEITALRFSQSRIMWPRPYDPSEKLPLCYSLTGEKPVNAIYAKGNALGVIGLGDIFCKSKSSQCPAMNWINDNPPRCSIVINMLCALTESNMIAIVRFTRSSLDCGKKIMTYYGGSGIGMPVMLSSEFVNKDYKYYIPSFTIPNTTLDKLHYANISLKLKGVPLTKIIDPLEKPDIVKIIDNDTGEVTETII